MAGFFTPGLPVGTQSQIAGATIPADTNLGQGIAPQSIGIPVAALGFGAAVQALVGTGNMTIDANSGLAFAATLTGNRTLTISNLQPGSVLVGKITQDATGSRTLTVVDGSGGATVVSGTPLTTTAAAVDLIGIRNIGTLAAPQYAYYSIAKAFA